MYVLGPSHHTTSYHEAQGRNGCLRHRATSVSPSAKYRFVGRLFRYTGLQSNVLGNPVDFLLVRVFSTRCQHTVPYHA